MRNLNQVDTEDQNLILCNNNTTAPNTQSHKLMENVMSFHKKYIFRRLTLIARYNSVLSLYNLPKSRQHIPIHVNVEHTVHICQSNHENYVQYLASPRR